MLKSIRLKNFKAYKDSGDIPLAPLTILIGANNTGKSTIFQAMLALKQTVMDTMPVLVTNGPFVELNGFNDIIHGKRVTSDSSFEISIQIDQAANDAATQRPHADRFDAVFSLSMATKEIELNASMFRINDRCYLSIGGGGTKVESDEFPLPRIAPIGFHSGIFPFLLGLTGTSGIPDIVPITFYRTIENARAWSAFFARDLHRIGPLRRRVPWSASIGARGPDEYGLGGENLIAALGSEEPTNGGKKTLLALVNHWIKDTKVLKRLHVDEERTGRMLLGDEAIGHKDINVAGMGEGISQLLPIVAGTLMRHAGDSLLIEQPEIHLHPALQAELGDLFIHAVQSERRQVLIETHSEHLLLRVRRRIAEGKIKPEEVAILFVEKHRSESTVRRLNVNERGHFSDWPKGFFDEAYQEAMALAHAASKKR